MYKVIDSKLFIDGRHEADIVIEGDYYVVKEKGMDESIPLIFIGKGSTVEEAIHEYLDEYRSYKEMLEQERLEGIE